MKSLTAVVVLILASFTLCMPASAELQNRKVMAFYYTWYGTPQLQGHWVHWNEGGHDPDRKDGRGVRDTGTTDHPGDLYDSNDPSAVRRHLTLAQKAGIDVLISTWWSQGDYHDKAARVLIKEAEKSPVKITLYYERVPGSATDPDIVSNTVKDFIYILDNYATSPAFFKHSDVPVIFIYSRALAQLSKDQWKQVVREVKKTRPVMLVADSRSSQWLDVFDALHEYNTVGQVTAKENYYEQAKKLVSESKKQNRVSTVTVIPGYDDSNIGRKTPIIAKRDSGKLYREMWSSAIRSEPDWVLICSFNEWHEGSEIEPSIEYGDLFIGLTSQYAQNFKSGKSRLYVDKSLSQRFTLKADGGLIVSCAPNHLTNAVDVTNLDSRDGTITFKDLSDTRLIVFEVGRNGKAYRRLPLHKSDYRGNLSLPMRPYTTHRLWTYQGLSRYVADEFDTPGKIVDSPIDARLDELAKHPVRTTPEAVMLYNELLAERNGISSSVTLQYPNKLPREYKMCVDRPFKVFCTVYNGNKSKITASLDRLSVPDTWKVSSSARKAYTLRPGEKATAAFDVTAPVRSVYDIPYPVSARWNINAGSNNFSVWDTVGVDITSPFEKDLKVLASTPTQAELTLSLKNNYPGVKMKDLSVELDIPTGWTGSPKITSLTLDRDKTLKFAVSKPKAEIDELQIVGTIFKLGDYRGSKRIISDLQVALGDRARAPGLWQVEVEDGRTETVKKDGRTCRHALEFTPGLPCYIYFAVSENFPVSGAVYVTIHYFDEGSDPFELQYDSQDPQGGLPAAYKSTAQTLRTSTNTWKSHTFLLSDARFADGQNGQADFRIASIGSGLYVDRVTVSKFPPQQ